MHTDTVVLLSLTIGPLDNPAENFLLLIQRYEYQYRNWHIVATLEPSIPRETTLGVNSPMEVALNIVADHYPRPQ